MASSIGYVRLYAGADGHSHFSDEQFSLVPAETERAGPVRGTGPKAASHYEVRVVPPGWERGWGPADRPILAVYLSGEAEVEASDGEVRRLRAGSVLLAEDSTGRGHRARVAGEDPVAVLHIHLPGRVDGS
ncbi:MAG: hypothetical protein R3246_11605 [Acidimicrobiia bacterium]|nr:hypothetical protein [Acidimicrobiia bacterium]